MTTLVIWIVLVGLGVYSIYITSPTKIKKRKIENLSDEIDKLDLIDFRDFLVSKWKDWFLINKELIKEIMTRKYWEEQGYYNYLFLVKTFALGIDKKIQRSEW